MELISTHIVMTDDIGVNGNLFGGRMMSWLDDASVGFATQVIRNPNVLTLKISECVFHRPSKLKNLIKIYGEVKHIGHTSITVGIEARRADVIKGTEELVCSTNILLVQVDAHGKPSEIKLEK
ncbi:MAG: hypothetical protein K6D57_07815 [Paludibacteraceae bacterium]|jgi:acyl-CoA thioesterase YciA|nr:hypothetical protein [Paludibacteraceae bacterium]